MNSFVLTILFLVTACHSYRNPYSHREILDRDERYQLEWLADLETSQVTYNVTVRTKGYVGLGLSRNGKMSGADIVIGGVLPSGLPYFSDRHAVGNHLPSEDPSQDWTLHEAWESETHTFLSFSRSFETCDEDHDLEIHGDVIGLIWAFGENDNNFEYHYQNRGVYWAYLLDPDLTPDELKPTDSTGLGRNVNSFGNWKVWQIPEEEVIPAKETTYMCKMYKTPVTSKQHMIGFRTVLPSDVDRTHIHHFLFERCVPPTGQNASAIFEPLLNYQEECYRQGQPTGRIPTQYCSEFVYVWGVGQLPTFFPDHVGIPVDPDQYFLLQMHYDNPNNISNVRVNYTLEIFYTDQFRQHEAALLVLGASAPGSPGVLVPPNSLAHEIYGHCSSDCTESMFPPYGIRIFNVFLHTHKAGRGLRLMHMRDNTELPWIAYDDNYNFDYQQVHILPEERVVLPGDGLFTRCIYENADRLGNVTVGGFSTRQEMCVAIVWYYNRMPNRHVCFSEILGNEEYNNFLQIYNTTWSDREIEMIVTSPGHNAGLTVSQVGNWKINWTIENRNRLQSYHRNLPQTSQCFSSAPENSNGSENYRNLRKRSIKRRFFWSEANFQENQNAGQNSMQYEFPSLYPWHIRPYERPSVCHLAK